MRGLKTAIIALLVGIAGYSAYMYFSSIAEKFQLMDEMKKANEQIGALSGERKDLQAELEQGKQLRLSLQQENSGIKENLRQSQDSLSKLQQEFQAAQKAMDELNSQLSLSKAENASLSNKLDTANQQASQAVAENNALRTKLSSIPELKKAMRELKKKIGMARVDITQRLEKEQIVTGNGGFMLRDGRPTFPSKIRIEVQPLPAQNP